ncbi:DUF6705 family protein [Flavobacterium aquatile]|uniref:DUF6705 domain-containing protein n=1 Tax=Flavobacterium aquatile LMG 4008 = ATCC 11947 TaxID=1453498 RepID=A0A095SVT4_9FLAO|nr:DUF6705 family protein [Flavobacterium aquatile]KGD68484.1 hypothetical protein LG45_09410 [Flavobacterium aquatile LMG 4008 = ATCC 11947]OXA68587.1 hypothetical protein B0A61_02430 [Flavobacterium aquatile LMG 4008 = ATCC 11947]GEC79468.1 hypothetical protein FAQ01_23380 [Flavobacterium aquatile]
MKNILFILLAFVTIQCKAQNPIIDLQEWDGTITSGMYLKDTSNLFNQFEGTWVYTNGNIKFKIILVKKSLFFNSGYYEDIMIGEYQYIDSNGLILYDSLDQINIVYPNQYEHRIYGNDIPQTPSPFDVAPPGEIRIRLSMRETPRVRSTIDIRKTTTVFGQEAIELFKNSRSATTLPGQQKGYTAYPDGVYILKKQP